MKKLILTLALTLTTASFAATAQDNWVDNCASCHGQTGNADTKQGKKLKIRDYSTVEFQSAVTDEELAKAIKEGVVAEGKQRMKAYADFDDAEVKALVEYIRSLKK